MKYFYIEEQKKQNQIKIKILFLFYDSKTPDRC